MYIYIYICICKYGYYIFYFGLPWWFSSKESACTAGDGLIPGSGRSPGGGNDNPLWYSCLGNPMDRGAWWAIAHEVTKSWTDPSDWAHTRAYVLLNLLTFYTNPLSSVGPYLVMVALDLMTPWKCLEVILDFSLQSHPPYLLTASTDHIFLFIFSLRIFSLFIYLFGCVRSSRGHAGSLLWCRARLLWHWHL